ncbi:hypothetical protein ABZX85_47130 [Streptomyces sp. NPDC004539]|uniref:hypothetical protein n=1 Tax=Streptomyces sp. NPDC004539 TaxID=3154280 RepID=UPI0033BDD763
MEPRSVADSWGRQPSESPQAFEAFAVYRDLGPARSVTKVACELDKSRTMAVVGRAAACHREQDRVFVAEQAQARRDVTRRHARLAQAVQNKAVARLRGLDPRELTPSEFLRYLQVATEIERKAVCEGAVAPGVVDGREGAPDAAVLTDEKRRAWLDRLELERRLAGVCREQRWGGRTGGGGVCRSVGDESGEWKRR